MDFSQFLNDYLTIKRLRGVTPGRKTAEAALAPYFDRQFQIEMAGRRQGLAERAQTSKEKQQGEALTWDKERTLADLAGIKEMTTNRLTTGKEISLNELAGRKYITQGELAGRKYITLGELAANRDIAMNRMATDRDIAMGRFQTDRDISYSNLEWKQAQAASSLDFDRWVQNLLKDLATIQDRNAVISNIINTFGSLGNMYLMDKYYKEYGHRRF